MSSSITGYQSIHQRQVRIHVTYRVFDQPRVTQVCRIYDLTISNISPPIPLLLVILLHSWSPDPQPDKIVLSMSAIERAYFPCIYARVG